MEKNRGTVVAVVAALIIAVVSLGVAFAAFSRNLTIDGSATVQGSTWKVFWASTSDGTEPQSAAALPAASVTKSSTASYTTASLDATSFTWDASFTTPGDYIIFTFYARNTGDFNAKVQSITNAQNSLTCTYQGGTTGDANTWCASHITYGIYKNEACTQEVQATDALNTNPGYVQYWVKVAMPESSFAANGSDLPSSQVNISASTVTVTYEQDGARVNQ